MNDIQAAPPPTALETFKANLLREAANNKTYHVSDATAALAFLQQPEIASFLQDKVNLAGIITNLQKTVVKEAKEAAEASEMAAQQPLAEPTAIHPAVIHAAIPVNRTPRFGWGLNSVFETIEARADLGKGDLSVMSAFQEFLFQQESGFGNLQILREAGLTTQNLFSPYFNERMDTEIATMRASPHQAARSLELDTLKTSVGQLTATVNDLIAAMSPQKRSPGEHESFVASLSGAHTNLFSPGTFTSRASA